MSESILPLAAPDDRSRWSSRPAGLRITYGELRGRGRAARTRRSSARGVVPGDVVAFSMANGPEIVTTFLAVVAAGAAAAPLNPGYTAKEFAFYLDDLQPRLVIGRGDDAPELPGAVDLAELAGDPRRLAADARPRCGGAAAAHQRHDGAAEAGADPAAQPDGVGAHGRGHLRARRRPTSATA